MLTRKIFGALADGQVHSGEALAEATGVTRSAVWKAISQLREMGLPIEAQTNRGYRLGTPCEALDEKAIRSYLAKEISNRTQLGIVWEIGSTNAALLESPPPLPFAAADDPSNFHVGLPGERHENVPESTTGACPGAVRVSRNPEAIDVTLRCFAAKIGRAHV